MYFPVTENVTHYPCLTFSLAQQRRKAVDQMTWQAKCSLLISSSQCQTSLNLSAQNSHPHSHLLLPICLAGLSCILWEHILCAVSATHVFSQPFLLLPFPLFCSLYRLTLHCSFLTGLWGLFRARKLGFCSKEQHTLTQTAHTVDCLPGVGEWIFLPQLWASPMYVMPLDTS